MNKHDLLLSSSRLILTKCITEKEIGTAKILDALMQN